MFENNDTVVDISEVARYIKSKLTRELDLDVIEEILDLEGCYLEDIGIGMNK